MKTLGICFGATTMQSVELDCTGDIAKVVRVVRVLHEGNPSQALFNFFKGDERPQNIDRVAVTGRAFRKSLALSSISEPEAIEYALHSIHQEKKDFPDIVVSSGGETQLVYIINRNGGISSVLSGNKCASGTGEFFLQQIRRMGLTLPEAVALAETGTPHRIAGRCSVFCKSDCTHALNKGESKANIAAGLCLMMADKIHELIKDVASEKIALIGGGSLNTAMIKPPEGAVSADPGPGIRGLF
jgi:activator of 2-hydroxyglutaryl-CoA dehydratase